MRKNFLLRPYIVAFALVVQLFGLFLLIEYLSGTFALITFFVQVISVFALLIVINKPENPSFKLPWAILILTTPVLGGVIYFLASNELLGYKKIKNYQEIENTINQNYKEYEDKNLEQLRKEERIISGQFDYLSRKGFPLYQNTKCKYYSMADEAFPELLSALKNAKYYVFLEYFIINQNSMWLEILDILEKKAAHGVEVRIIYDDIATMSDLPKDYPQRLAEKGIQCIAFNPFIPLLTISMNNRDHRKIAVIDGRIAFTGGFNLSDEYINRTHPFGESWKDAGVKLTGEASWQFTLLFLNMWQTTTGNKEDTSKYLPVHKTIESDGFVQPYGHIPVSEGQIVGDVYRNIINQASNYLYIYTPYLIPDPETMSALTLAADRGVDVRIMLPGVPDKKIIYQMTKAHYDQLLKHGVHLYEYTPGFLHSKCVVCDDRIASVGTANFDNRSLYHSFENGCLFYRSSVVRDLKKDFINTLKVCRKVQEMKKQPHIFSSVYYAILRVFSPLL